MRNIKKIKSHIKLAVVALPICSLISCAHVRQGGNSSPTEILANVKTVPEVRASIENWEKRVGNLKLETNTIASKDRFLLVQRKIGNLDSTLKNIRNEFFSYRTSDSSERQKTLNGINEDLNRLVEEYHSIPAE